MKLSKWCKIKDIHYMTGYNWFKEGRIPNAYQESTGSIFVNESEQIKTPVEEKVFIYARVSNRERRKELDYQVKRCEDFCIAKGLSIDSVYKEIASGMNDDRRELWNMIEAKPTVIVVENKDRLTRFGFNYLERLLNKLNCKILVINKDKEDEQDLIKDLVSIITSFCCRIYGLRRGRNKTVKIKAIINDQNN